MRILAGELRGRRVEAPPGRSTRPMLARVREALFETLTPWLAGAAVLDLYAGSGGLGLEALSRGARAVRAVERDPAAVRLLRRNAAALGTEERVTVVPGDALDPGSWAGEPADIVFLDPPFPDVQDGPSRAAVLAAAGRLIADHLAPEGVLVLHGPARVLREEDLPAGWIARLRRYGRNDLWYVQPEEQGAER